LSNNRGLRCPCAIDELLQFVSYAAVPLPSLASSDLNRNRVELGVIAARVTLDQS
jgi:hypothetical protein